MIFKSIIAFVCALLFISCNAQTSKDIKTVEVAAFAKEIKATQKPQILDVRTPEEFNQGHIDNAMNIDWLGNHFIQDVEKLNKNKAVYVYCRSGKRSLQASEKLAEMGFKKIYNLDGGYQKWTSESNKKQ